MQQLSEILRGEKRAELGSAGQTEDGRPNARFSESLTTES